MLACVIAATACSKQQPANWPAPDPSSTASTEPSATSRPFGDPALRPASLETDNRASHTENHATSKTKDTTRTTADEPTRTTADEPTRVRPDDTGKNRRDVAAPALTPTDQSEKQSDLDITKRIRQAIVGDGSLSFTAKNVKIITVDGKVTLRGPVNTAAERATVEALARKVAGAAQVDNQLEVKP